MEREVMLEGLLAKLKEMRELQDEIAGLAQARPTDKCDITQIDQMASQGVISQEVIEHIERDKCAHCLFLVVRIYREIVSSFLRAEIKA